MAHEKEQEIVSSLRAKNNQLLKAMQAIEHHKNQFDENVVSCNLKKVGVDAEIKTSKDSLYEKQSIFRQRRAEQKEIQQAFDAERVKKFASLIDKKEEKYINLAQLAQVILKMTGQEAGTDAKDVPTALFNELANLKLKMNIQIPSEITDETIAANDTILNDLSEKYTKKGSPKEFKKVFKYSSIFNWASKFMEVVKAAKEVDSAQVAVDAHLKDLFEIEDQESHIKMCQEDLEVFNYDKLKEEQEKIQAFIWRIEKDNKIKMIAKQLRLTQFETNYFGLINAYKKKSMEA